MRKLNLNQMENIIGGVSVQEYCATLQTIMENNPVTESMTFFYSYHSCDYYNEQ